VRSPTANSHAELDAYVGTDDPPTATGLSDASTAAGAGVQELTIPVTQSPVAIVLSLPIGLSIGNNGEVKYPTSVLQDVYDANVPASSSCPGSTGNTWCDLLEAVSLKRITSGVPTATEFLDTTTDLGGPITLMARSKSAGLTYAFQGFLFETGDSHYPITLVSEGPSNWPVTVQECATAGQCGTSAPNGTDAQLVANTTATPGSIGYAAISDAALASPAYAAKVATTTTGGTHQIVYAFVEDNEGDGKPPFYASPSNSAGTVNIYTSTDIAINQSTCPQPSTVKLVGCWVVPITATGSWNGGTTTPGTFPSDPDVYDHGAAVARGSQETAVARRLRTCA